MCGWHLMFQDTIKGKTLVSYTNSNNSICVTFVTPFKYKFSFSPAILVCDKRIELAS